MRLPSYALTGGGSASPGSHSPTVEFIAGAIFLVVGLLNVVKPDVGWRMSRWQYRNQSALEPSAAGLVMARVSGAVALVAGVFLIVRALQ